MSPDRLVQKRWRKILRRRKLADYKRTASPEAYFNEREARRKAIKAGIVYRQQGAR